MKTFQLKSARLIWTVALSLLLIVSAEAATLFTDNFNTGPSPLWGNEVGGWVASGGAYYATAPNNMPNAYSSLPYNLTDFSIDFDINNVMDGGVFLRMEPAPGTTFGVKGILLNLKIPDGGPKIYWHVFNGDTATPPLNIAYVPYGNNPHVHVEVSGNIYAAFLDGSSTPATTLVATDYSSGRIALYDFSGQSFDNVVLTQVPEPALSWLLGLGVAALVVARGRKP